VADDDARIVNEDAIKVAKEARGKAVKDMATTVMGSYNPNIDRAVNARIGVLAVKADLSAVMQLLVEKGILTEEEIWQACARLMRQEADAQQLESAKYSMDRAEAMTRKKR